MSLVVVHNKTCGVEAVLGLCEELSLFAPLDVPAVQIAADLVEIPACTGKGLKQVREVAP